MALDKLISKDFYLVPTWLHTLHSPGRTPTTVLWEAEDETVVQSQSMPLFRGPQLKANIVHKQWDSRWVGPGNLSVLSPGGWLAQILHSQSLKYGFSSLSPYETICSVLVNQMYYWVNTSTVFETLFWHFKINMYIYIEREWKSEIKRPKSEIYRNKGTEQSLLGLGPT